MINCANCKRYNDSGAHKSCLAGRWEIFITGTPIINAFMPDCLNVELVEPIEAVIVADIKIDKRTKAYKDARQA